jgi:prophage tail gpP-like protein
MPQIAPVQVRVTTPEGIVWQVPQFLGLSLSLSMREFSDAFELTLGDPGASLISKVYNDCTVTVLFGDTTVLVGQVNIVEYGEDDHADTITVTGRSKASEWAETDAIPKKYKATTDNDVIQDLFAGSDFTFDLADPVPYKDWDVGLGIRKAEAASRIAQEGGFSLWHSGTTIYKQKVASEGTAQKTYVTPDVAGDGIPILANTLSLRLDTSKARSRVVFFAAGTTHTTVKETRDVPLTLKLQAPERSLSLNRIQRVPIDAKDAGEAQRTADANTYRAQPTEVLRLAVRGRDDLPLNAVAHVTAPRKHVDADLVCYEKQIHVTESFTSTTKLSFVPLGRPLPSEA